MPGPQTESSRITFRACPAPLDSMPTSPAGLPHRRLPLPVPAGPFLTVLKATASLPDPAMIDKTTQIAKYRTVVDRNRHRARKSKSPSTFPHARAKDTITRTAPAVITLANTPA